MILDVNSYDDDLCTLDDSSVNAGIAYVALPEAGTTSAEVFLDDAFDETGSDLSDPKFPDDFNFALLFSSDLGDTSFVDDSDLSSALLLGFCQSNADGTNSVLRQRNADCGSAKSGGSELDLNLNLFQTPIEAIRRIITPEDEKLSQRKRIFNPLHNRSKRMRSARPESEY